MGGGYPGIGSAAIRRLPKAFTQRPWETFVSCCKVPFVAVSSLNSRSLPGVRLVANNESLHCDCATPVLGLNPNPAVRRLRKIRHDGTGHGNQKRNIVWSFQPGRELAVPRERRTTPKNGRRNP